MRRTATLLFLLVVVFTTLASDLLAQQTAADTADREITPLRGDLYRVRDGAQYTVFLVTPDGIILADPLNRPFALWLKEEFVTRFPDRTVRYVIHTHHRFDRAEGAVVFNDTAELIGHRNFSRELSASRFSLPSFLLANDRNRNGTLERAEWSDAPMSALIATRDRNKDEHITPDELYRLTRDVESVVDSRRTVTLGGKTVEIIHPGPWNEADTTVLYFPDERFAFAAEAPPIVAAPFSFGAGQPRDVITWVRTIARLEFDTLLSGQGDIIRGLELVALHNYLDALVAGVAAGYEADVPVAQLQTGRMMDAFSAQPYYASRATQIAAVHKTLSMVRAHVFAIANVNYPFRQGEYCMSFTTCNTGGAISIGTSGVSVSLGRVGVGLELTLGAQSWSSRTSRDYDEEFAFRESRVSFLVRYPTPRTGGFSYSLVGGPSSVIGDTRGMLRAKERLAPLGGRYPILAHESRLGLTVGVEAAHSLGPRFTLVVPVRATRTFGQRRDTWPSLTGVQVGAGLAMRVLRRVN